MPLGPSHRPGAILWPCLLLGLSAACVGVAAWTAKAQAGHAGPRTKPSCQVMIGDSIVRSCGYIDRSDACCMRPLPTSPIASTMQHLSEGPAHSNVTFTTLEENGLFLISHDEDCGAGHECWEVSLGRLGQLGGALDDQPPGPVEVLVSFLAGPRVYNVSVSTVTTITTSRATGGGDAECRTLRSSTPVLDIAGQDATLRLVPPPGSSAVMPPVCITFHSDQCRVDCKDFAVPAECKHSRFHQSVHCVEKPFDTVLTISNVTRPDLGSVQAGQTYAVDDPLQFHCARLQLGGCVLATPTVAIRMRLSSEPAEVSVVAAGPPWSTPGLLLVTIPLCLAALLLCAVHNFGSGFSFNGWRQYPRQPMYSHAEAAVTVPPAPCRRVVLVYCRPVGQHGRALAGALRALAGILGGSGKVQVVDMYDDPRLLEDGGVARAAHILADEDAALLLVLTPMLAEALRPGHGRDPFQQFIATLVLGLSHAPLKAEKRVFPVSLDAQLQPELLLGVPITAVYVMPYHLADLLRAIPGVSDGAYQNKTFNANEQKLKMFTKMYAEGMPDADST